MIVNISNTFDKPFGELSNDSYSKLFINGFEYNTVTNYVLSNMVIYGDNSIRLKDKKIGSKRKINQSLIDSIDVMLSGDGEDKKKHIKNIEQNTGKEIYDVNLEQLKNEIYTRHRFDSMNIFQLFREINHTEFIFLFGEYLRTGYEHLIRNKQIDITGDISKQFKIHIPPGNNLPVWLKLNIENMAPNVLYHIRNNMVYLKKSEFNEKLYKEWEDNIYDIYVVYNIIKDKYYRDGNIDVYKNKNVKQILDILSKQEIDNIREKSDKKSIIKLYLENDLNPIINHEVNSPGYIGNIVEKYEYQKVQLYYKNKHWDELVNTFLKHFINKKYSTQLNELKKNYKNVNVDVFLDEKLRDLDEKKLQILRQNILELYSKDKIPKSIKVRNPINIKTPDWIDVTLNTNLTKAKTVDSLSDMKNSDIVNVDVNHILHPMKKNKISIQGRSYNSVLQYIMISLFAKYYGIIKKETFEVPMFKLVRGMGLNKAYTKYKNKSILYMIKDIEQLQDQTFTKLYNYHSNIGLQEKFKSQHLQNLLITSQNHKLEYNIKDNLIKNNKVADIIQEIRNKILKRHNVVNLSKDKDKLLEFFENDTIVNKWIQMRIKDFCNTIFNFQQYMISTHKKHYNINNVDQFRNFIHIVLKHIYEPCFKMINMQDLNNIDIPNFVTGIIMNCKGLDTGTPQIFVTDINGKTVFNQHIRNEIEQQKNKINILRHTDPKSMHIFMIKQQIMNYQQQQLSKHNKYVNDIKHSCKIYWLIISKLLTEVYKNVKKPISEDSFRLFLVENQLNDINSKVSPETIENSIINVLQKIQHINTELGINTQFTQKEINLAESIITNKIVHSSSEKEKEDIPISIVDDDVVLIDY